LSEPKFNARRGLYLCDILGDQPQGSIASAPSDSTEAP
jgi:hypothetical protein